jgi:hypothetical protein
VDEMEPMDFGGVLDVRSALLTNGWGAGYGERARLERSRQGSRCGLVADVALFSRGRRDASACSCPRAACDLLIRREL